MREFELIKVEGNKRVLQILYLKQRPFYYPYEWEDCYYREPKHKSWKYYRKKQYENCKRNKMVKIEREEEVVTALRERLHNFIKESGVRKITDINTIVKQTLKVDNFNIVNFAEFQWHKLTQILLRMNQHLSDLSDYFIIKFAVSYELIDKPLLLSLIKALTKNEPDTFKEFEVFIQFYQFGKGDTVDNDFLFETNLLKDFQMVHFCYDSSVMEIFIKLNRKVVGYSMRDEEFRNNIINSIPNNISFYNLYFRQNFYPLFAGNTKRIPSLVRNINFHGMRV